MEAAMRISTVCIMLCLVSSFLGAMPIVEQTEKPWTEEDFSQTVQTFADALFSVETGREENRMLCPPSALLALSMAANGATGKTKAEMVSVLTDGRLSLDQLNEAGTWYLDNLPRSVRIADSLWVNDRYRLASMFQTSMEQSYQARITNLDFSKPENSKTINSWVKEASGGAIDAVIDAVRPEMVLFLVNVFSFKDDWLSPFDARSTKQGVFHTPYADTHTSFLNKDAYIQYTRLDDASLVVLPYKDDRIVMALLLVDETQTLNQWLEKHPSASTVMLQTLSSTKRTHLSLSIPTFASRYETSLVKDLGRLGMIRCFSSEAADFSRMLADQDQQVFIDEVLHKTYIKVDEAGTEAAAVTVVGMRATSIAEPPSLALVFDRPFLFVLFDTKQSIPLFIGALYNPLV
jgi:serpin B